MVLIPSQDRNFIFTGKSLYRVLGRLFSVYNYEIGSHWRQFSVSLRYWIPFLGEFSIFLEDVSILGGIEDSLPRLKLKGSVVLEILDSNLCTQL